VRKSWVRNALATSPEKDAGACRSPGGSQELDAVGTPQLQSEPMDDTTPSQTIWKIGDIAKLQGRLGKVSQGPDSSNRVTLEFADGSQCSNLDIEELVPGTLEEWQDAEVAQLSTEVFEAAEVQEAEAQMIAAEASIEEERKLAEERIRISMVEMGEAMSGDDSADEAASIEGRVPGKRRARKKGIHQSPKDKDSMDDKRRGAPERKSKMPRLMMPRAKVRVNTRSGDEVRLAIQGRASSPWGGKADSPWERKVASPSGAGMHEVGAVCHTVAGSSKDSVEPHSAARLETTPPLERTVQTLKEDECSRVPMSRCQTP